jgi:PleD family two-component response regulator
VWGNRRKWLQFSAAAVARFLKLLKRPGRRTMMMTNTTPIATASTTGDAVASPATQRVVIVNGSTDMLSLLETVLEAGHYDVVFVESSEHAYSHIKRVQPNLVILCVNLEDYDTFHVLSMLKLDDETRRIPVLTYMTDVEGRDVEPEMAETADIEMFTASKMAFPMN